MKKIERERIRDRERLSPPPLDNREVSTWVVVVVVRELFSLMTSVICARIRGDRSEVLKLFTTWLKFFVYCCVLTTVGS